MKLTDTAIRKAKTTDKPSKLSDGHGLYLLVQPTGSRLWRWDYRYGGKRKTLGMGAYPITGLADARARRDDARRLLASGVDPSASRREAKAALADDLANTFGAIAEKWRRRQLLDGGIGHRPVAEQTARKHEYIVSKLLSPKLGRMPIASITRLDMRATLDPIADRGDRAMARRAAIVLGQIFAFAVDNGILEANPAFRIGKTLPAPQTRNHAAVTDRAALGELLQAIDAFEGQPSMRVALRLLPLVFTRPSELRLMEWSEVDLDAATWVIPKEKTKMRREHVVPLSTQAVALLRELHLHTAHRKFAFASSHAPKQPISGTALTNALRRTGFDSEAVTAHGFRSTASTILNELGFNPDVIERQLAHVEGNRVRAAYLRSDYLADRTAMMQKYSDMLDTLKTGSNVVGIKSARRT